MAKQKEVKEPQSTEIQLGIKKASTGIPKNRLRQAGRIAFPAPDTQFKGRMSIALGSREQTMNSFKINKAEAQACSGHF